MSRAHRWSLAAAGVLALSICGGAQAQPPNPYRLVEGWPQLPQSMNGGKWGELIGVDLDPQGDVWVFHRCFAVLPEGSATCVGRDSVPPILKFDPSGKLLASMGEGMFAFPHGFCVDGSGNIWATDANGSDTVLGLSAKGRGQQVFELTPTGRVLMTLGKAGIAGNGPDTFDQPTAVAVAPNGDIFVTDGHGNNNRVVKFSKDGRFLKSWGQTGAEPGQFNQPHTIAMDSQGRVFVGDRGNGRIQIFDQEGRFLDQWKQFGRPSVIFIGKDDSIYVSDSTSNSANNAGRKRGIFVGSARDGSVKAFMPDPDGDQQDKLRISGASGITADATGSTVYAADVGPHRLRKYVKR